MATEMIDEAARRERQMEELKRRAASHQWDGPAVSLGYGLVATCSKCGADESDDYECSAAKGVWRAGIDAALKE